MGGKRVAKMLCRSHPSPVERKPRLCCSRGQSRVLLLPISTKEMSGRKKIIIIIIIILLAFPRCYQQAHSLNKRSTNPPRSQGPSLGLLPPPCPHPRLRPLHCVCVLPDLAFINARHSCRHRSSSTIRCRSRNHSKSLPIQEQGGFNAAFPA